MNTDPFHRKAIKQYDRQLYDSLDGYTKRAQLSEALESLKGFGTTQPKFSEIERNPIAMDAFTRAVADAKRVFTSAEPLIRTSLADSVDALPKGSSAGVSFPGKTKGECIEDIFDTASYMQHFIQKDRFVYVPPCKLALRGHLHSIEKEKTRAVWITPAEILALEGKWSGPLSQWLSRDNSTMFNGPGILHRALHHADKYADKRFVKLILDWSAYDQTVPDFVTDAAFDIAFSNFDDRYVEHDGRIIYQGEVGVRQSARLRNFIQTYFTRTKLMLPNGDIIRKKHGIPSGSSFTSSIGTIANYIVCHFLLYLAKSPRPLHEHYLGDDAELTMHSDQCVSPPQLSQMRDDATYYLGMTLNKDKVVFSRDKQTHKIVGYNFGFHSLQRFDEFGDPDREWFKLVLYAESDIQDLHTAAARLHAYYLLGGALSAEFCAYMRYFVGVYPMLINAPLPKTRKVERMLKGILGDIPPQYFQFPILNQLDKFTDPWLVTAPID